MSAVGSGGNVDYISFHRSEDSLDAAVTSMGPAPASVTLRPPLFPQLPFASCAATHRDR